MPCHLSAAEAPEDLWTCHECGWAYPNHHPSAKHRRNHKKVCGKLPGFTTSTRSTSPATGSSDDGYSDDEPSKKGLNTKILKANHHLTPPAVEHTDACNGNCHLPLPHQANGGSSNGYGNSNGPTHREANSGSRGVKLASSQIKELIFDNSDGSLKVVQKVGTFMSGNENESHQNGSALAPSLSEMKPTHVRRRSAHALAGIWICRHCGWTYPNAHPSAKHRRKHKKKCTALSALSVPGNVAVASGASSDDASSDEESRSQKAALENDRSLETTSNGRHVCSAGDAHTGEIAREFVITRLLLPTCEPEVTKTPRGVTPKSHSNTPGRHDQGTNLRSLVLDLPSSPTISDTGSVIEIPTPAGGRVYHEEGAEEVQLQMHGGRRSSSEESDLTISDEEPRSPVSVLQVGLGHLSITGTSSPRPKPSELAAAEAPEEERAELPELPSTTSELPAVPEFVGDIRESDHDELTDQEGLQQVPSISRSLSAVAANERSRGAVNSFRSIGEDAENQNITDQEDLLEVSGVSELTIAVAAIEQQVSPPDTESQVVVADASSMIAMGPRVAPVGEESVTSCGDLGGPLGAEETHDEKCTPKHGHVEDREDLWICRSCGWTYPNAHPSAKHRRNHKKKCGKGSVTTHGNEGSSDEESSEDDHDSHEGKKVGHKAIDPVASKSKDIDPSAMEKQLQDLESEVVPSTIPPITVTAAVLGRDEVTEVDKSEDLDRSKPLNMEDINTTVTLTSASYSKLLGDTELKSVESGLADGELSSVTSTPGDHLSNERSAEDLGRSKQASSEFKKLQGKLAAATVTSDILSNEINGGLALGDEAHECEKSEEEESIVTNVTSTSCNRSLQLDREGAVGESAASLEAEGTIVAVNLSPTNVSYEAHNSEEELATQNVEQHREDAAYLTQMVSTAETDSPALLHTGSGLPQAEQVVYQATIPDGSAETTAFLKIEMAPIVHHEEDLWTCRHCGWTYPNAHPSAKHRRKHKQQCGNTSAIAHAGGEYSDEANSEDDEHYEPGEIVLEEPQGPVSDKQVSSIAEAQLEPIDLIKVQHIVHESSALETEIPFEEQKQGAGLGSYSATEAAPVRADKTEDPKDIVAATKPLQPHVTDNIAAESIIQKPAKPYTFWKLLVQDADHKVPELLKESQQGFRDTVPEESTGEPNVGEVVKIQKAAPESDDSDVAATKGETARDSAPQEMLTRVQVPTSLHSVEVQQPTAEAATATPRSESLGCESTADGVNIQQETQPQLQQQPVFRARGVGREIDAIENILPQESRTGKDTAIHSAHPPPLTNPPDVEETSAPAAEECSSKSPFDSMPRLRGRPGGPRSLSSSPPGTPPGASAQASGAEGLVKVRVEEYERLLAAKTLQTRTPVPSPQKFGSPGKSPRCPETAPPPHPHHSGHDQGTGPAPTEDLHAPTGPTGPTGHLKHVEPRQSKVVVEAVEHPVEVLHEAIAHLRHYDIPGGGPGGNKVSEAVSKPENSSDRISKVTLVHKEAVEDGFHRVPQLTKAY